MRQTTKSITLVSLFLLSLFSGMVIGTEQAEASQVVITEAVRIVDGGTASDNQAAVASDSEGNVHIVWARNTQHLYYSMLSPRGETLIDATQITNPGLHKVWHPDMVIDDNDRIHLVWADKSGQHKIMYTSINPYLAPLDGMAAEDTAISVIDDTIISMRAQDRDWPSIDVDSQGNLHIAWQDSYDELQQFFNQPQIYYSMIQPEYNGGSVLTLFEDTLLTPIIGHKGHPDIVVDSNDLVQIAWDDTRGGKVELVFLVDTSGSMYSEWADVCTVIYGGNFAAGGYFQGLKPMLEEGNMTVYETIYGLETHSPGAASSGNCATHNKNAGPRSTVLALHQEMTLVVSENFQEPSTTVTHTPDTLERTGAQEPTGHVFLGRMHKATSQEILRPKTITSGIRTQQRSLSRFPMKDQRTAILHSKRTIQPPLRKHTTTVSTQVSFL